MLRDRATRLLAAAMLITAGCGGGTSSPTAPTAPTAPTPPRAPFSQTDLRVGTGAEAAAGRFLTVNYTGWLYDPAQPEGKGPQFDTSIGRGPYSFQLGAGRVIPGWDQGLAGMNVGGLRRLVIPPELAYGSRPNGGIPADSTLVFDVELLDVE